jgi:hypothetical protein
MPRAAPVITATFPENALFITGLSFEFPGCFT